MNGNVSGGAYALTVLTPITPGQEAKLRSHLDALPTEQRSPLARLTSTHFARYIVIDDLVYQGPPQKPDRLSCAYLLFTSNFDGDLDAYLEDMHAYLREDADAIWGHCVGYPGSADLDSFKAYFRHNQLPTTFFVAAYPDATVSEVRAALALRQRVVDFALRSQGMEPDELHQAFLEDFSGELP
jgi:hypothetical protein